MWARLSGADWRTRPGSGAPIVDLAAAGGHHHGFATPESPWRNRQDHARMMLGSPLHGRTFDRPPAVASLALVADPPDLAGHPLTGYAPQFAPPGPPLTGYVPPQTLSAPREQGTFTRGCVGAHQRAPHHAKRRSLTTGVGPLPMPPAVRGAQTLSAPHGAPPGARLVV